MLVSVRMAAPSTSLPCAGAHNAARGKSLLLAYVKEIFGQIIILRSMAGYTLWDKKRSTNIREQLGIF